MEALRSVLRGWRGDGLMAALVSRARAGRRGRGAGLIGAITSIYRITRCPMTSMRPNVVRNVRAFTSLERSWRGCLLDLADQHR